MVHKRKAILNSVLFLVLVSILVGCNQKVDVSEQTYRTHEEAILNYMKQNDAEVTSEKMDNAILTHITENDIDLYLLKDVRDDNGKLVNYVYIVEVLNVNDSGYTCKKITADFTLQSIDDVKDVEYTPYSEYVIPVGELYIHVGMIFDSKHKPYFEGKELSLDDDNVFFQITKDDRAEIEIRAI